MSFAFICFHVFNVGNERLQLDSPTLPKHITTSFSYLITKSDHSLKQVLLPDVEFTEVNRDSLPFSLDNEYYWLSFELKNSSFLNEALLLHVDHVMLSTLIAFEQVDNAISPSAFDSTQKLTSYDKGNYQQIFNLSDANALTKAFPHFPVTVKGNSSNKYLIKINRFGPPNVPIRIYEEKIFENRIQATQFIFSAFIAIAILMTVYNLVLYFAIKDKVYLVYVGYLLSSFIVLSSVNGFGFLIFPDVIQHWLIVNSIPFHFLIIIFLLLFALFFLRFDLSKNTTFKVGISICITMLVLGSISIQLSNAQQAKLFFSLQPFIYAFALYLVTTRLRTDFSWAKYYFFSWIPFLIGAAVQPLMLLNYLEYSFVTRNAFFLGVLFEVSFMSLALAERMRRNEQERLMDIGYHQTTKLPRKLCLENAINKLILKKTGKFSVLVIQPEQIEKISLYVHDEMNSELYKRLSRYLSPLFAYNDAIVDLTNKKEKICLLDGKSLAVLLNYKRSNQPISVLIKSIQDVVGEAYQIDQLKLPLSCVVGIANYPENGETAHHIINNAQLSIKDAQLTNKKWAYFEVESSDKASYFLKLASDIDQALINGGFELFHQPQIDLKTLRVCGSECLIRWNHATEGFIPPKIFIPIAEDIGMINKITLWVVKQALLQHQEIVEAGNKNHMVSINISGRDISSDQFFNSMVGIIEQSEISADKIILELTESSTFTDNEQALEVLEKLNDLGITISIDDFGTGYSSLSYINKLPFQELKIDRQFVENVCESVKRRIITETTVKMAKGLSLEVVAEGINSKLDEDTLRQYGCDIGQGFYYSEPKPLENYLVWLDEQVNGHTKSSNYGEFIPVKKQGN